MEAGGEGCTCRLGELGLAVLCFGVPKLLSKNKMLKFHRHCESESSSMALIEHDEMEGLDRKYPQKQ